MKKTDNNMQDNGTTVDCVFQAEWALFGPVGRDTSEPDFAAMAEPPAALVIAGRHLTARKVSFPANHRLDLGALLGGKEVGKTAYLLASITADREMNVTLGAGADWWMKWWINGQTVCDTLAVGNVTHPPSPLDQRFVARLKAGRNLIAVKVVSGGGSFVVAAGGPRELRQEKSQQDACFAKINISKEYQEQQLKRNIHVRVGFSKAEFNGKTNEAIQSAIDFVAANGGGTVEILPGTFRLFNSIRLRHNVQLIGSGEKTILFKPPSVTLPLTDDTDGYEWRVTVADTSVLKIGGGLVLQAKCPHSGRLLISKYTITGITGKNVCISPQVRENFWVGHNATATTIFPLITADWVNDFGVANLVLDGNREKNAYLNGNYGGALFFQDCERVTIDSVSARNMESDALSFQTVHDLKVENCRFSNCKGSGIHPGTGSQRPIIRHNRIERCDCGIGWCWGVKHGLAENNVIERCLIGIAIGHRDTDNVMRGNTVRNCPQTGLEFRPDPRHQAAHRNLFENNLFENNGTTDKPGCAVSINAPVNGVIFQDNKIICTRKGTTHTGILIGPRVTGLTMRGNKITNIAVPIDDQRKTG